MPYGTIKIDTITFTDAGVDKSIAVSGLVQNPTFTGNVTVTGTVSGATVRATTVSGVTVSGTTANFASGVFTTQISGAAHVAPAGTAGAPSIQVGTGASVSPGFYGAGTDLLGISTGGSSRLLVDSVGQIRIIAAGSAAAPSLILGNDLTTGLYSPGAGEFAISTGGTERLRITANGYVGIGTTGPSQALTVFSNDVLGGILVTGGNIPGIRFNDTSDGSSYSAIFGQNGGALELGADESNTAANTYLSFRVDAAERARIDSSGRLLVGTSFDSGGALFQVNGDRIRVGTAKTPASASDTGTAGEICWDASYIYVCTATNTWKRTAIATW